MARIYARFAVIGVMAIPESLIMGFRFDRNAPGTALSHSGLVVTSIGTTCASFAIEFFVASGSTLPNRRQALLASPARALG